MSTCSQAAPSAAARAAAEPTRLAAHLLLAAARSLTSDPTITVDRERCRRMADALAAAINRPGARTKAVLDASPYVIERSGKMKPLVAMIAEEGGDEGTKLRLARLLLRALEWH